MTDSSNVVILQYGKHDKKNLDSANSFDLIVFFIHKVVLKTRLLPVPLRLLDYKRCF
jgi:hypothetical protein